MWPPLLAWGQLWHFLGASVWLPPIDKYPKEFVPFLNDRCVTTFQGFGVFFFISELISLATSTAPSSLQVTIFKKKKGNKSMYWYNIKNQSQPFRLGILINVYCFISFWVCITMSVAHCLILFIVLLLTALLSTC